MKRRRSRRAPCAPRTDPERAACAVGDLQRAFRHEVGIGQLAKSLGWTPERTLAAALAAAREGWITLV